MTSTIQVGDATLAAVTAGSGPDLVLLHAGIGDRRMWAPQIPAFAAAYRVTAYDLRGFGESPMVEGPYAHYRDLRVVLDHLGTDQAILVGASMGGSVAIDFTLEHPDRVSALVLSDPGLDGYRFEDPWLRDRWRESADALERDDFQEAAAIECETWLAGPHRKLESMDPAMRNLVRDMLLASYPASKAGGVEEGPDRVSLERLAEIQVPTLVVVGALDVPDMKRISEIVSSTVPGARHAVLENTAHLPSLERPDEFNRLVLEFLSRALDSKSARG